MKPTSDWRSLIKVHPAAEMFPTMEGDDLKDLAEDIKANGLTSPVTTLRDKAGTEWLLDGRNRLDAMALAGYQFKRHGQLISSGDRRGQREPERFKVLSPKGASRWAVNHVSPYFGTDPYTYVVSANIRRRHLTADQKRDLIAALLKANPERSDSATAKLAKVSDKTVGAKRKELEATSEIPKLDKRVGADGKTRSAPKKSVVIGPELEKSALALAALSDEEFEKHVQEARQAVHEAQEPAIWTNEELAGALEATWKAAPAEVRKDFLVWIHEQHQKMFHDTCKIVNQRAAKRIAELGRAEQGQAAAAPTDTETPAQADAAE